MDRTDVVYLVNSTPKYYYLLPFHFMMLRRYAPGLRWAVVLATETPNHPVCQQVAAEYGVEILPISENDSGFLDSRRAALAALHRRRQFRYVFPIQEDFILEMPMREDAVAAALQLFESDEKLATARFMPCPGPATAGEDHWPLLTPETDPFGFSYQATLWRLDACYDWFVHVCRLSYQRLPVATAAERLNLEVRVNLAENADGQHEFWALSRVLAWRHRAWRRLGPQSNAVYLSPFPYRPTAIVRGKLEEWAIELARREGVRLEPAGPTPTPQINLR